MIFEGVSFLVGVIAVGIIVKLWFGSWYTVDENNKVHWFRREK